MDTELDDELDYPPEEQFEPKPADEEQQEPVFVPYRQLSAKALRGVVESYVLREGTDYGTQEFTLDQKVAHVMRQLECGDANIVFDPNTESIHIVKPGS